MLLSLIQVGVPLVCKYNDRDLLGSTLRGRMSTDWRILKVMLYALRQELNRLGVPRHLLIIDPGWIDLLSGKAELVLNFVRRVIFRVYLWD